MKTKNLLLAMLFVAPMIGSAQPGTMDATFGDASGTKYLNFLSNDEEWMTHMVVDDQDRIWIAGQTEQDGDWKLLLTRLTPDGLYDTDFGIDGHAVINLGPNNNESVQGMALHNNGLVIVGHTTTDGETNPYALRYTLTGVLDFNFGDSGILPFPLNGVASDVTTDTDGNIYVSGMAEENVVVYKILPNGEFDSNFGFFGLTWAEFPSVDESAAIEIDEDGNIYVFGNGLLNGVLRGHITSFMPNGAVNTNFTANGRKSFTWPDDKDFSVHAGILSNDASRFYLVGETNLDGDLNGAAIAVDISSDLITDFGTDGFREYDLTIGGDEIFFSIIEGENGIYVSAMTQEIPSGINTTIVHLDENGDFVNGFGENESGWATFNIATQQSDYGTDLAFQSDGKLVVSGVLASQEVGVMGFALRLLTELDDTSVANRYTELSAYPNPCIDEFWLETSDQSLHGEEYRIFNLHGQLIQSGVITSSIQQFNVSQLPAGVYQLVVGNRFTGRFIKQQ